ncbi:hypothetical protein MIR68_005859 [Amoeboaphelidium protococcarum]|nr:hypothetical protein MIR68_005859 [Amoeboaphelidium protococcarum]
MWHLLRIHGLLSAIIDFVECIGGHSAPLIRKRLMNVLQTYSIELKIVGVTTDNASNIVKAINDLVEIDLLTGTVHIRCVAHALNLAVKEGLEELMGLLDNIRAVHLYISRSPMALQIFEECCNMNQVSVKLPVADVDTRWNSTFDIISRALEMKAVINLFIYRVNNQFNNDKLEAIEDQYWNSLAVVQELLAPFKAATVMLSGSNYPTVHQVREFIISVCHHLSSFASGEFLRSTQVSLSDDSIIAIPRIASAMFTKLMSQYQDKWSQMIDIAYFVDLAQKDCSDTDDIDAIQEQMLSFNELSITSYESAKKAFAENVNIECQDFDSYVNQSQSKITKRPRLSEAFKRGSSSQVVQDQQVRPIQTVAQQVEAYLSYLPNEIETCQVQSLNCVCFCQLPLYLPAEVASSSSCSSASQSVVSLLFPIPRLPAFRFVLMALLDLFSAMVWLLRLLGVIVLSAQGVCFMCLSQSTMRIDCTLSSLLTIAMSQICNICGLAH